MPRSTPPPAESPASWTSPSPTSRRHSSGASATTLNAGQWQAVRQPTHGHPLRAADGQNLSTIASVLHHHEASRWSAPWRTRPAASVLDLVTVLEKAGLVDFRPGPRPGDLPAHAPGSGT
ncbi:hypothetical protein ACRAWF_04160 [Streptomyces sp. L7]